MHGASMELNYTTSNRIIYLFKKNHITFSTQTVKEKCKTNIAL